MRGRGRRKKAMRGRERRGGEGKEGRERRWGEENQPWIQTLSQYQRNCCSEKLSLQHHKSSEA